MKKTVSIILAAILALSLVLMTGCSSGDDMTSMPSGNATSDSSLSSTMPSTMPDTSMSTTDESTTAPAQSTSGADNSSTSAVE